MLSERVKWWFRSRDMVTAGEKDLSSLPTAATRAWAMSEDVRITRPPRGWTLYMARGAKVNQAVGISENRLSLQICSTRMCLAQLVIAYFRNCDIRLDCSVQSIMAIGFFQFPLCLLFSHALTNSNASQKYPGTRCRHWDDVQCRVFFYIYQ